MNIHDFEKWVNAHTMCFPETATWLHSLGDDRKQDTLLVWRQLFAAKRITLTDAMRASRDMLAGDAQAPAAYERERTPAFVVAAVRDWRRANGGDRYRSEADIAASAPRQQPGAVRREASGLTLAERMVQLIGMAQAGVSKAERDRWDDEQDRIAWGR